MEVAKRFPIPGLATVQFGEESLKVKYRYPTHAQARLMGEESNNHGYAMAICKYCIEEIEGLTENGVPITVEKDKDGTLTNDFVVMLHNNELAVVLAAYYMGHVSPTALDKKKLSSQQGVSKKESDSSPQSQESEVSVMESQEKKSKPMT